ncbi:MAG: transglycosylase domain-containing protein, partial [Polyangiaceae bacterium]
MSLLGAHRHRWWSAAGARTKRAVRAAAMVTATAVVAWATFAVIVRAGSYPSELLDRTHASSFTVTDASGRMLRQTATARGGRETWVSLDRISPHLVNATLAAEDRRFWEHGGVDPLAILRAAWLDLRRMRAAYGGSTLTMQLVRTIEPPAHGGGRTLSDKIHEAIVATRLERVASKAEILEQYLNRVYYGNGAWGVEAAARRYFGKPAASLSLGEAAFLAVLPRGPRRYDPYRKLAAAEERRAHVLHLMQRGAFITPSERELAERTPLGIVRERLDFRAPHFVDFVRAGLTAEERNGAAVVTTLDVALQQRLEVALAEHLGSIERRVGQAAIVVLRHRDGAILGMVGSRDYFDAAHDGAANAVSLRRRPGSTLKPFVYGIALERGDTAATIAHDVRLGRENYESYASDAKQHGPARYREALAGSYNLAAIHTIERIGVPALLERLRKAGIATLDREHDAYGPGLAVGDAEVRLIDLAAAYAAFGNEGRAVVPRAIQSVTLPGRAPEPRDVESGERIFAPEIAYLVFDILSDPDARRPMFGSQVPMALPFPVALKTGTTRAFTDNLAFGVTREYTVAAWAGNHDGSPTDRVMAMQGAAPLVRAAFVAIAALYGAPTSPSRPQAIVTEAICPVSGMRPGLSCPSRKSERFLAGTVPVHSCDWHRNAGGHVETIYPREAAGWAQARKRAEPADSPLEIVSPA